MGKKLVLIICLFILSVSVVKAQVGSGDVNGDGGVDFQDARALASSMTSVFDMSGVVFNFGNEVIGPTVTPNPTDPPSGGGRLAPVGVSGNKHYLVKDNGDPFLWIADTAWDLNHRLKREEIVQYLNDRKAKGFTVIMFRIPLSPITTEDASKYKMTNRYGQAPFVLPGASSKVQNLATINAKYFENVDYTLDELEKRDMVAGFLPLWGWAMNQKENTYKNMTDANVKKYGEWLGNRYKNRGNIVWISGGDTGSDGRWATLGKGVKKADIKKMVTFHPGKKGVSSYHMYGNSDWLDFHMTQTGHSYNSTTAYSTVEHVYLKSGRPIINGESVYEKIDMGYNPPATPIQVRKAMYWSLFAGGFGTTYGHTEIFQFAKAASDQDNTYGAKTSWVGAMNDPAGKQMAHLSALLRSVQWHKYVPNQSLISSSNPSGAAHMRATMKSDKTAAMIYIPEKKAVTVKLSGLSGEIRARWFNPQTGVYSGAGSYPASGTKSFTPPFGPDSVLVLD